MACVFPGMDPFLERRAVWPSFHTMFLAELTSQLNQMLPAEYAARIEQRLVLSYDVDLTSERRAIIADTSIFSSKDPSDDIGFAPQGSLVIDNAPLVAELAPPSIEPLKERAVEIYSDRSEIPVTTIELLSYSNKYAGRDRDHFNARRDDLLNSTTSYIEIDLLRGGKRLRTEPEAESNYAVFVSPVEQRPRLAIHPFSLRDRIPDILVPLLPSDEPLRLDLQRVFSKTFTNARYDSAKLARQTPDPPLQPDDAAWAASLIGA